MAGEWLKFDCTLPEKQETLAITAAMGWDDPDTTVGKLMRLFRWFDQQTIDGNAANVTPALLDRVMGVSGFVSAVVSVGWIVVTDRGLSLANFDRHNGATAKSRVLTAKRVANHKANATGNAKGNAVSVSAPLPRVEKSREDKNKEEEGRARATRIPPGFEPTPEHEAESGIDRQRELANFRDYWTAKGGANATKLDWQATWRQWARKADRPSVSRFAKPDPAATVPSKPGRDPEILKAENDLKNRAPMPESVRALLSKIKQGITA